MKLCAFWLGESTHTQTHTNTSTLAHMDTRTHSVIIFSDYAGVHSQEVIEIFHLLVALAHHFRCPHPLPRHVQIKRIHLKQLENKLETKLFIEGITGADIGPT